MVSSDVIEGRRVRCELMGGHHWIPYISLYPIGEKFGSNFSLICPCCGQSAAYDYMQSNPDFMHNGRPYKILDQTDARLLEDEDFINDIYYRTYYARKQNDTSV